MFESEIKNAQDKIEKIKIGDLAENMYNVVLGHLGWRNRSEHPFEICLFGGKNFEYEYSFPHVSEVYNNSNQEIKKKIIDSITWLIDDYPNKINGEKGLEEMHPISIFWLINYFSGREVYSLDWNPSIESKSLILENSNLMREYIKTNFRNSLLKKINGTNYISNENWRDDFKKRAIGNIVAMEIMPLDFWKKEIKNGFGGEVFHHRCNLEEGFFEEEKILTDVNEMISYGFKVDSLKKYFNEFGGHPLLKWIKNYRLYLDKINDPKIKKDFINLIDKVEIKSQKYYNQN